MSVSGIFPFAMAFMLALPASVGRAGDTPSAGEIPPARNHAHIVALAVPPAASVSERALPPLSRAKGTELARMEVGGELLPSQNRHGRLLGEGESHRQPGMKTGAPNESGAGNVPGEGGTTRPGAFLAMVAALLVMVMRRVLRGEGPVVRDGGESGKS